MRITFPNGNKQIVLDKSDRGKLQKAVEAATEAKSIIDELARQGAVKETATPQDVLDALDGKGQIVIPQQPQLKTKTA